MIKLNYFLRNMSAAGRALILIALFSLLFCGPALGMPGFSRQTGLACSSCHYTFPELTRFGRDFKLNGYTLTGMEQIKAKSSHNSESGMQFLKTLPASIIFRIADTATNKPQPGTQNWNVEFPQAINLYLTSAIWSHAGADLQITYSPESDHLSIDNSDFRYANRTKLAGKDFRWGFNLDNNPTEEDLWHGTPAWGFPWVGPDSAPTSAGTPIISGVLSRDVGGFGGYTLWNNHLYGDFTLYRSMHVNSPQPPTGSGYAYNIRGAAPYWRVAWQQDVGKNYFEVGTYGMHMNSTPGAVTGPEDDYTDVAADFQYERPLRQRDELTIHGTYIHQSSDLHATFDAGGASFAQHHFNTLRADGTYHFGNKYGATFGGFANNGTADPTLFAPNSVTGSANGNPKSNGFLAQFSYWPVQNVMLTAQYTGYVDFNGTDKNYDGSGRNGSNNNTLYLLLYLTF